MKAPDKDSPGVVVMPPLIFAACLVAGFGLDRLLPRLLPPAGPLRIVASVLLAAAAAIALWAFAVMRRAGTSIRTDKSAWTLVTSGPFRFTRNPLYLSLCMLNAGLALLAAGLISLSMTLVLAAILQRYAIAREEKHLAEKFGPAYADYCRRVRRWI